MPQSLAKILLHVVFSTKERRPFLHNPAFRDEMHHYIGGILNGLDCPSIIVGGVEDHVHLLCALSRTCAPAASRGLQHLPPGRTRRVDCRGESRQLIRLLEQEVRLGYWPHVEFDWTGAVRTASELAAEHSLQMVVRGMDLFHVSIAIEVAADAFLSFDDEQNALAEAAGLPLVRMSSKGG